LENRRTLPTTKFCLLPVHYRRQISVGSPYITDDKFLLGALPNGGSPFCREPYFADKFPYIADDKPYITDDNPYITDI
jgi:hypothetical protein